MPAVTAKAKEAVNRRALAKYHAHRDENRSRMLRQRYGITWKDKVQMYGEQKGLCKLCNEPLPEDIGKCQVDHDHETDSVRGLLHHRCNLFLGYLEQDEEFLEKALTYLENTKHASTI